MSDEKKHSFEEILADKGYLVYTSVGGSMLPLLRERRDIIEIRPVNRRVRKYEVALYRRGGKYILHRCLAVGPEGYVFAGDNNIFKEYDVTDSMILGVMTRVIRDGRSVYTDDPLYRLYSHIWVDFFPVKVLIKRARGLLGRLKRALRKPSAG